MCNYVWFTDVITVIIRFRDMVYTFANSMINKSVKKGII